MGNRGFLQSKLTPFFSKLGAVKVSRKRDRSEWKLGVSCMSGLLVARDPDGLTTARIHPRHEGATRQHAVSPHGKVRNRNLVPLLKTQLLDLAGPELLEQGRRLGAIGEQVQARLGIDSNLDCTVVNAIINPVRLDPQALGDLGDGQAAGDLTRVGLAALVEEAMTQAEEANRAEKDNRCQFIFHQKG
jgi:hypothetical protein